MKEKTKNRLKTIWTIVLIIMVSSIYAYRKYYRKELRRKARFEQSEAIMEQRKAQQQLEREAMFIERQNSQNAVRISQQKELDSLRKASEAILKSLENSK